VSGALGEENVTYFIDGRLRATHHELQRFLDGELLLVDLFKAGARVEMSPLLCGFMAGLIGLAHAERIEVD
jgi:hypothetical protein